MKRFSLIGRLGPDDKTSVKPVQTDSAVYEIDFLAGDRRMGFGIGQALDQIASLGLRPSERAIDLVLLAALVNAGDTRVSRSINAQDGWTREIDLYAPVSAPKAWNEERQSIEALLKFRGEKGRTPATPLPPPASPILEQHPGAGSSRDQTTRESQAGVS